MPTADFNPTFTRLAPALVRDAAQYASSIFADVNGRRGGLHGRIAAINPQLTFAGSALTVEVRPGDNLMIHAAIAIAQEGDVLVVDGKGDQTCALMGSIMMNQCKAKKLAAVVLDAAARDLDELREMGFPVYAVGANPNGPSKGVTSAPGRVNRQISIGGVTVNPGDLVVGDADGVTVIAAADVATLLPQAAKKVADEKKRIAEILGGDNAAPKWLSEALRSVGVFGPGESL